MYIVKGALSILAVGLVLTLTSCGSENQAKENTSGSHEPTQKNSKPDTAVSANGSTPTQGTCRAGTAPDEETAAKVAAATERAMKENHLKAALVRVTKDGKEVATLARGESMIGVPATEAMHFRNGAVAISYLGTILLQLVDEGKVELDETIDEWLPELPASDQIPCACSPTPPQATSTR
jgi:CubicO group peptidase (beta-lactamase class C family)